MSQRKKQKMNEPEGRELWLLRVKIFKKAVHIDRLLFLSIYLHEYKNINPVLVFPVLSSIRSRA